MTDPTDDEIAAALVAVQLYLEAERPDDAATEAKAERWRVAARLAAQGVAAGRGPAPHWGNIERLRRGAL